MSSGKNIRSNGSNEKTEKIGEKRIHVAILDDYQSIALQMADWSVLEGRAKIKVFRDHLSDPEAIVERLKPFDIVCVMRERTPLPQSILQKLPALKMIVSTGHSNLSIDMAAAKDLGIIVCGTGTPATQSHSADELTWALILAMVRDLPREIASLRQGNWQISIGSELRRKTIGVLGLGKIGQTIAKVANAFEMNVVAWSQNMTRDVAELNGAKLVSKEELFRTADIVTIHLILSERTKGIVGERELSMMKPTAYLVNTSRGPLVDEDALIDALKSRRIAGAALDVYNIEPLPQDHPFRSLDNVLATPHIGFVTKDSYRMFYQNTVEDIVSWLDGEPIRIIGN